MNKYGRNQAKGCLKKKYSTDWLADFICLFAGLLKSL